MIKVKICGLRRKEDVIKAIELGFDALGFILCEKSKRHISLEEASLLTEGIPPFVSTVAVVMDPTSETLEKIVKSKIFTHIQFHGAEPPEMLKSIPLKVIKSIPIAKEEDLNVLTLYMDTADYFLFDTKIDGRSGGTGLTFDWSILKKYQRTKPFILSGGIGINNLESAIREVQPDGIDVNSSLEVKPGIKDHGKMERFINLFRSITGGVK